MATQGPQNPPRPDILQNVLWWWDPGRRIPQDSYSHQGPFCQTRIQALWALPLALAADEPSCPGVRSPGFSSHPRNWQHLWRFPCVLSSQWQPHLLPSEVGIRALGANSLWGFGQIASHLGASVSSASALPWLPSRRECPHGGPRSLTGPSSLSHRCPTLATHLFSGAQSSFSPLDLCTGCPLT